jgi:hypothetical protein
MFGRVAMLIPFMLVAGLFWKINTGTIRALWFSEQSTAVVSRIESTPSARGPSYQMHLSYQHDGTEYTHAIRISAQEAATHKEGDRVDVQFLPEHPEWASLVYPGYPKRFVTGFSAVLAVGPLIGVLANLWALLITPWRIRRLLRDGEATAGTIVDFKAITGKGACLKIAYEFEAAPKDIGEVSSAREKIRGKMWVPGLDFRHTQVGDAVTVIYDRNRPQRSIIYEYADYEFAPLT